MMTGTSEGIPDAELVAVTAGAATSVVGSQPVVAVFVPVGTMVKGRAVSCISVVLTGGGVTDGLETGKVVMGEEAVEVKDADAVALVSFELPEPIGPVGAVPFEVMRV